jgi:hypothetical protein
LLGPGDVLRPWRWDSTGSHVQAEVGWVVLEPTRMAVLDHGLVVRMAPWPQLGLELFARGTRRAHSLAVALAIAHHPRVDDRLLLTLWHLAERWGRVRPDGIALPLPLSHQRLADLVGAHRPSVTTAMGDLTRSGTLSPGDDGVWALHGAPPSQLRNHRRDQAQDRDQEQKRMDDNTAGDGDDQQDDCECEKHAHLRIGFLHISPAHRGQHGRGYRFRRLNADVAGRRSRAIRLRAS